MITNNYPNRGEINDVYSTLELGASGLVLAAETAIGKNPIDSVKLLKRFLKHTLKIKDKFYEENFNNGFTWIRKNVTLAREVVKKALKQTG